MNAYIGRQVALVIRVRDAEKLHARPRIHCVCGKHAWQPDEARELEEKRENPWLGESPSQHLDGVSERVVALTECFVGRLIYHVTIRVLVAGFERLAIALAVVEVARLVNTVFAESFVRLAAVNPRVVTATA
jgi:hypothetical protein